MGVLNINFFLICFGILGCYAAWRTTHRPWLKVVLGMLVSVCLLQLLMNRFFPPQPHSVMEIAASRPTAKSVDKAESPATTTSVKANSSPNDDGIMGYLHNEWTSLQNDSCALTYMRETPLSPVVYALHAHKLMENYKQMRAMGGRPDLGTSSRLLIQSFGDEDFTNSQGNESSLCDSFGKWATKVAGRPPEEQRQIWDNLRSSDEEDYDRP